MGVILTVTWIFSVAFSGESGTPYRPDTADLEIQKIQSESAGVGGGANESERSSSHTDTSRSRLEE